MDYYCKTTRSMLAKVKEVGALPFFLFEYYLTFASAPNGIKPSLQRISDDLGLEKSNICNLRKKLIDAGWIAFENDEIFILKSFTQNEQNKNSLKVNAPQKPFILNESDSQKMNNLSFKMNDLSQKMNDSFILNESPLKDENKQSERTIEKEKEEEKREREATREKSEMRNAKNSLSPVPQIFLENNFLKIFGEFYPNQPLDKFQITAITNRIRDGDAFRSALEFWKSNNYRSESVGKICDKHDEILMSNGGKPENGRLQNNQRHVDAGTRNSERIKRADALCERLEREAREELAAMETLQIKRDKDHPQGVFLN